MKEINLWGVYVAPFASWLVLAAVVYLPVRWWFDRIEVQQWFWHRRLFDTAIFVIILSVIGLLS